MGLDVTLFAEGDISDEQIAVAEALFRERGQLDPWKNGYLERSEHEPNGVQHSTLMRYYGPGYERGNWPAIYADILLMRAAFPGMTVYYGHDCQDVYEEATDERLKEIWDHWLSPNGKAYYR